MLITTRLQFAIALIAVFSTGTLLAQVSAVTSKHVVVRQTLEAQTCASNCSLKEAYLGSPHAVGEMLKLGTSARAVHGTVLDGVPVFPRKATWSGPNESDLITEYNTFIQANIVAYATAVTSWQSSNGLATASHDIIQKIEHRGKTKRAIVNLITFDNGNYYYNGVKIVPDDPATPAQVLYVRSIPSAPGGNLPTAFNWPTPGTLQHSMRSNFDFITSAGLSSISVGNVYDEPFNFNNVPVNPDARLVCLLNHANSGCGQTQPDIASLIGSNDATFAIVDYYRVVKPVGQPYAGKFAGIVNGRVTNRAVNFTCDTDETGTYTQIFQYTQRLAYVIDRYTVYPDGKMFFTQRFREERTPTPINIPASVSVTRGSSTLAGIIANTTFAHHRTSAMTTAADYAPNTLPIDPVAVNMGTSCSSCTVLNTVTESRTCPANSTLTYTATKTFDASVGVCQYNGWTDNSATICGCTTTSTCICPPNTTETQACPAPRTGTMTVSTTYSGAACTPNTSDDRATACSCPADSSSQQACPSPRIGTMTVSTTYTGAACNQETTDNASSACKCPAGMFYNPLRNQCLLADQCPGSTTIPATCPAGTTGTYTITTTWSGTPPLCTSSTTDDSKTACEAALAYFYHIFDRFGVPDQVTGECDIQQDYELFEMPESQVGPFLASFGSQYYPANPSTCTGGNYQPERIDKALYLALFPGKGR